jgi:hypothetical protein
LKKICQNQNENFKKMKELGLNPTPTESPTKSKLHGQFWVLQQFWIRFLVQLSIIQTPIALNFGKIEIETKSWNPTSTRMQILKLGCNFS